LGVREETFHSFVVQYEKNAEGGRKTGEDSGGRDKRFRSKDKPTRSFVTGDVGSPARRDFRHQSVSLGHLRE
jgi:hypothetical protein